MVALYRRVKKIIPIPIKVFIKELIKNPIRTGKSLWQDFQFSSGAYLDGSTLSIIVLTYGALPYTKRCIKSIINNTEHDFELIVIDNASVDGTREWLKKLKGATVILNNQNKGVSIARNQGIKLARNDFIVFLDNDIEVRKNWDIRLLSSFRFKKTRIVGSSGGLITSWHPLKYKSIFGSPNHEVVDYVSGWCFAFQRKLVDEIGLLDEKMGKFWHEDLEYCLRAKKAGYEVRQSPKIPIIHYEHKSQKNKITTEQMPYKTKGFQENANYIVKKFLPYKEASIYRTVSQNSEVRVLDTITNYTTRILRQRGWKVNRCDWLPEHTKEFSFLLCNPFVIEYKGIKFTNVHQENDRPPKRWRSYFNKYYNFNLSVSGHCIDALGKGGFKKGKLLPYFHGVNPEIFNPDISIKKKIFPGKFKFLTVGASQPRKNTRGLIDIYCKAFNRSNDVVLIIKDYDYGQRQWILEYLAQLRKNKTNPEIVYMYENWVHEEIADLYRNVAEEGAYISVHHAECFGLPVLEAACCGIRAGVTGWGGPKDFIDEYLFPYKLMPSKFHYYEGFYEKGVKPLWAEPDPDSVIRWMRKVYKEKPNKQALSKRAYSLLERYSWDKVVDKLEEYFRYVDETHKGTFYDVTYWSGREKSGYESYQECEVQEHNARNLFETFNLKGAKVLDLGCCFGYEVKYLNKLGADAYGCDISHYAVQHAYDKKRIKWGDIVDHLPYPQDSFDFIYSLSTFEHLDPNKIKKTLIGIRRIMKKGGMLFVVVSVPNDPEFFDDKSHRIGESEVWWEQQFLSVFVSVNKTLAKKFYEQSEEAKQWNWHIYVAEKT